MTIATNTTAFRTSERLYKQRSKKLDVSDVFHFRNHALNSEENQRRIREITVSDPINTPNDLLQPASTWKVYQVDDIPGTLPTYTNSYQNKLGE